VMGLQLSRAHQAGAAPLPVARSRFGLALVGFAFAGGEAELDLGAAALVEIKRETARS